MNRKPIHHASFSVERAYKSPRARVYKGFTDKASRRRWLIESDGWTVHHLNAPDEVRPGAVESSSFSPPGADVVLTNDTTFLDVQQDERLIFAYAMTLQGEPLSSSLTTVEFLGDGEGSRIVLTEQGAYYGDEDVAGRKQGMSLLLEALAREIGEA